jgi:hypothetical protein
LPEAVATSRDAVAELTIDRAATAPNLGRVTVAIRHGQHSGGDHDHEIPNLTRHRVGLVMVAVCRTAVQFANHFPPSASLPQRPMQPGARRGHRPVSKDVLQAARSRQVVLQASLKGVYRSVKARPGTTTCAAVLLFRTWTQGLDSRFSQLRPAARLCGRPIQQKRRHAGVLVHDFPVEAPGLLRGPPSLDDAVFREIRARATPRAGSRPNVTGSRLGVLAAGAHSPYATAPCRYRRSRKLFDSPSGQSCCGRACGPPLGDTRKCRTL